MNKDSINVTDETLLSLDLGDYLFNMDRLAGNHQWFQSTPQQALILRLLTHGMPIQYLDDLCKKMQKDRVWLITLLNIEPRNYSDSKNENKPYPAIDIYSSEKLLKIYQMINMVRAEVKNEITLNPAVWLAEWIESPLPALDNNKPSEYMQSVFGLEIVAGILAVVLGDAYA